MAANFTNRAARLSLGALAALAAAALLWRFPLVRVTRIGALGPSAVAAAFDAESFSLALWNERLPAADAGAHDATDVFAALRSDPAAACREFGRAGGARSCLYVLRGSGVIAAIGKKEIEVSLVEGGDTDVFVATGLVFGNVVRDAAGWTDPSAFSSLEDYNAISEALNRIVETRVLPELNDAAAVGRRIEFLAAAEVKRSWTAKQPLTVIPLRVTLK